MDVTDPARARDDGWLREAIALAVESARSGGGPFGAIVVRDGRVIARGTNRVVRTLDPTAHAEVVALREAARTLGTHVLRGCVLYASCEPCPMCLGAAYWARIDRVVHAATREQATEAGFDDGWLHAELRLPAERRSLRIERSLADEAAAPFAAWAANPERVPY